LPTLAFLLLFFKKAEIHHWESAKQTTNYLQKILQNF